MKLNRELVDKLVKKMVPISLNEYTSACICFSNDTEKWLVLDDNLKYFTDFSQIAQTNMWTEATEKPDLSINISWAFNKTNEEIKLNSQRKYDGFFDQLSETAIDNGWYQSYSFIDSCVEIAPDNYSLIEFIGLELFNKLTKYPGEPDGECYFLSVELIENAHPEKSWDQFDWTVFGSRKIIYQDENGLWDSME